jgi:hypothetical protein
MNNGCICSRIFLLKILIFKGLTARRLYKLFGVKVLIRAIRFIGTLMCDGVVSNTCLFTRESALDYLL